MDGGVASRRGDGGATQSDGIVAFLAFGGAMHPLPRILALATAVPPHVLDQETVIARVERMFAGAPDINRLISVYANARSTAPGSGSTRSARLSRCRPRGSQRRRSTRG
jgi:hypothetical protein